LGPTLETQTIKNFSTGVFPSHWLEMVKSRLYDGDEVASWSLHRIVRDILTSLSPICPFFTHYLSTTLYNQSSVDIREFPQEFQIVPELIDMTIPLIEFNSNVWKIKKESGLSLNSEISEISIPDGLGILSTSLIRMHRIV